MQSKYIDEISVYADTCFTGFNENLKIRTNVLCGQICLTQRVPNIEAHIIPTHVLASISPQTAIFQQT